MAVLATAKTSVSASGGRLGAAMPIAQVAATCAGVRSSGQGDRLRGPIGGAARLRRGKSVGEIDEQLAELAGSILIRRMSGS